MRLVGKSQIAKRQKLTSNAWRGFFILKKIRFDWILLTPELECQKFQMNMSPTFDSGMVANKVVDRTGRDAAQYFTNLKISQDTYLNSSLELSLSMNERNIIVALLTVAGFIAGMIAADFLGLQSWLDEKMTITLVTGLGFVAGHLLARKRK